MIDKSVFEKIKDLKTEYEDLEKRLNEEENKVLVDSVKGSSKYYPYTQHTMTVEGIQDSRRYKKYKRMLKKKQKEIEKKMVNFEYQMHYVDDGEMKTLLRLKYIDGLTNFQIAHKMNEKGNKKYTEDSVRMQIKRFLEKN